MPQIVKAWYTVANHAVSAGTAAEYKAAMAFALKEALTGGLTSVNLGAQVAAMGAIAGEVVQSSDSATAGAVDYITTAADVVFAAAGVAHSWWVVEFADFYGAGNDLWMLFDCRGTGDRAYVSFSRTGYSGGTITDAPTATDEIVVKDGATSGGTVAASAQWDGSAAATSGVLHLQVAADGTTYRWFLARTGAVHAAAGFMRVHRTPTSGMTNDAVFWWIGNDNDAEVMTWTLLQPVAPWRFRDNGGVARTAMALGVVYGNTNTSLTTQTANVFDGSRYAPELAIWSTGARGVQSVLPDWWWAASMDPSGTKAPTGTELYAQVGSTMIAWPVNLAFGVG